MKRSALNQTPADSSRGYSLVELMVAITIGFFLIAAVISTFIWSTRNYNQDDSTGRQQENARFALDAIAKDLRMAGFMFDVLDPNSVTNTVSGVADDCGPGYPDVSEYTGETYTGDGDWLFETKNLVESYVGDNVSGNYECITDVFSLQDNIDPEVLAIKRVRTPQETEVNGDIYLQATLDGQARLIALNYVSTPANASFTGATNWEYVTNIYYIKNVAASSPAGSIGSDTNPTLFRKTLRGTNFSTFMDDESDGIAEGIEHFHITWGIDREQVVGGTIPDGQPNYYVSTVSPGDEMSGAVTAQIHVLVRSPNYDIDYVDDKTYTLGDLTIPPSAFSGKDKHYRRKVFTTTVKIRNRIISNNALSLIKNF